HVIQDGYGANSVFLCGTTGEFDKLRNRQRQRLLEIGCEEVRRINQRLMCDVSSGCAPVEAWAGVTARTKAETLENLALAVQLKAEMAVIAPMAIDDLSCDEIVPFFKREVAAIIQSAGSLTIALYDNPGIASHAAAVRHIPIAIVETLNKLPFVVCIKASTSRDVLQKHMLVSLITPASDSFNVYVGNAPLIFEFEDIHREIGVDSDRLALAGVVSGPANLLPREWRAAWQAVVDRDALLLMRYQKIFARFDEMCIFWQGTNHVAKNIAALKRAMFNQRLISSACVAPGTPALTTDEAQCFDDELAVFLDR
ncbi:MAG: dihydrodipicolinate synthase family protein, partial [Acidobacteriota bacterium]|nr:dihydrodipicolinate synthase family protein [Acidobacteriota bacterium]